MPDLVPGAERGSGLAAAAATAGGVTGGVSSAILEQVQAKCTPCKLGLTTGRDVDRKWIDRFPTVWSVQARLQR
jgi:hypothetical protein